MLAVAAEASADREQTVLPVEDLVAALPDAERREFLVRLVRGEAGLARQLMHLLRELADYRNRRREFDARVRDLAAQYHNRPALLGRLRERGLLR